MNCWLTSHNKKRHQRAINKLVRAFNKQLEQDDLWCGRFAIRQVHAPQWSVYKDGSGANLFVHLKFIDRATGQCWLAAGDVNHWRSFHGNGYHLWETMNWLITQHWDVWQEEAAQKRDFDAWRVYNKNTRKV